MRTFTIPAKVSLVARRESPWWMLLRFAPKFWEGDGDLQMIFCQSGSAVWVASTLISGENT